MGQQRLQTNLANPNIWGQRWWIRNIQPTWSMIHGFERLYAVIYWGIMCWPIVGTPIKQQVSGDDRGLWTVLKLVHKRLCDAANGGDNWLMTHGSKYQPGISGKLTSNLRTSKSMNRLGLWQQNNICSHVKNWRVPPRQFLVSVIFDPLQFLTMNISQMLFDFLW